MEVVGRRRSTSKEPAGRPEGGLEPPFPSCPKFPPVYGLYCKNKHGVKIYQAFRAAYAAKKFVDTITQGTPTKWLNCATVEAENGVIISSTTSPNPKPEDSKYFDLELLMEYDYSLEEEEWEIPYPHADLWAMFPVTTGERAPRNLTPGEAARPERKEKVQREPKPGRMQGYIPVGKVAERMGIEATKARAALRKSGEPKPPQGWEWPPSELDRIIAIIKDNLK